MAVIENPRSGERIVLLRTAEQTGGELLSFELTLQPGGRVPAAHAHPRQHERFTVLEGRVRFRLGTRASVAGAGESVLVAPGTAHSFANAGPGPARVLVEVRPALNTEQLLATAAELSAGSGRRHGLPHPLDLALFLSEFEREVAVPVLPRALVCALTGRLARFARRTGLDARYRALRAGPRPP